MNIHPIIGFFRLIRITNLLYIILAQYLLRQYVVLPLMEVTGITPNLTDFQFFLLVLSTVLVAAAGYIINDYFDVKLDYINKPERIIIDRMISRRTAMKLHLIFNAVAILIAVYLGWLIDNIRYAGIHVIAAGLLWFYSTSYKKQFLVGNVIVSLLTATVLLIVAVYEITLSKLFLPVQNQAVKNIMIITLGYMIFAYLVSMIREIVKDMEDIEGDRENYCRTMPIVLGIRKSVYITAGIVILTMSLLAMVQFQQWKLEWYERFAYTLVMVQIPLATILVLLWRADKQKDFSRISLLVKFIMLAGIISMPVFQLWLQ